MDAREEIRIQQEIADNAFFHEFARYPLEQSFRVCRTCSASTVSCATRVLGEKVAQRASCAVYLDLPAFDERIHS
jgi:hypothetical protein